MRRQNIVLPLLAGVLLLVTLSPQCEGRRVRVKPRPVLEEDSEDQEGRSQQIQYYAAQPQGDSAETEAAGVVLVSQDTYNGLYGRQAVRGGQAPEYRTPLALARASSIRPRVKEQAKQPPVQTLRNYNTVNDDGSFTFGYEAADGSFKEETRGTDCVVRGKYGYVDPDGNKREFTYVSGNPCDPNSVGQEEEEEEVPDSGEENIPKGPLRPLRPLRPTPAPAPRPTTTVFQQSYNQDEGELDDEPQHSLQTLRPTQSPLLYQPQYRQEQAVTARPVLRPQPAVRITPRPPTASTTIHTQLPATTYRPQLLQLSVTPRPGVVYSKQVHTYARPTPASIARPTSPAGHIDFDAELRNFQIENNVVTTPRSARPIAPQQHYRPQVLVQQAAKQPSSDPIYESELVYDPASGQYNTVVYQQVPKTGTTLNLSHRLQPYVHQPAAQQSPLYQQTYHQQQQAAVLQQSQQLYAQQQQQRAIEQQHRFQSSSATAVPATKVSAGPERFQIPAPVYQQQRAPQGFYYVAPGGSQQPGIAHGQIDAFLRGHNLQY